MTRAQPGEIGPPAGQAVGAARQRFCQPDKVDGTGTGDVVVWVAVQVVGAESGQPADEIELRQRRAVAAVDARVGLVEASVCHGDGARYAAPMVS